MKITTRSVAIALASLMCATLLSGTPAQSHEVGCATTQPPGGDWPMMGGDLRATRFQDRERFLDGGAAQTLAPMWTFDANRATNMANNEITGYPIIADGCVFVGSSLATFGNSGWVFALNADTGELVWRTKVNGGVYNTVAYDDGVVYAFISRVGSPYVAAFDASDGSVLWERTVDNQVGSDAVASPIVFEGLVWVGVSGTAAEIEEESRIIWQGNYVILDADTGERLAKTYTIPEEITDENGTTRNLWEEGYSGGAIWSTMAVDPETKHGYVGTGNPFDYENEHENTNAILKIDLDRSRTDTFGEIVGSYKGTVEEYEGAVSGTVPCEEIEQLGGIFAFGFECFRLDLDFGATPNIIKENGKTLVAAGQKSGVLHVIDPATMTKVYDQPLGVPSAVGGIVGSSAYDGSNLYGPHTLGGYLWSVRAQDGNPRWIAPVGSGINWGPPATVANRVVYTVELSGFLDAFDAATGAPLLRYPLMLSPDGPGSATPVTDRPPLSWGGVSVARGTVYVSAGVGLTSAGMPSLPSGFVIAFRPRALGL